jgi:hypothetical protein
MKKLAAIFFLTIYTATAFGVVIKFHYCDHNLTQVIISDLNGNCTCNSKSFIPKDCCTDKTICLQVNSQRITQPPVVLAPKFQQVEWVPATNAVFTTPTVNGFRPTTSFNSHQRAFPKTIYLLDRVFRI